MFLHEFREDFVLALELLFQEGDPPVVGVTGASSSGFEGGGGVLEELLLPTVEHCGMDVVLVTEVRNRDAFEEMKPKDGGLLLGTGAFPSLLGHGKTSARDCSLFERFVFPIPTEAEQLWREVKLSRSTYAVLIWEPQPSISRIRMRSSSEPKRICRLTSTTRPPSRRLGTWA